MLTWEAAGCCANVGGSVCCFRAANAENDNVNRLPTGKDMLLRTWPWGQKQFLWGIW